MWAIWLANSRMLRFVVRLAPEALQQCLSLPARNAPRLDEDVRGAKAPAGRQKLSTATRK